MSRPKTAIRVSIATIFAISIWMGVASNPLNGIGFFFVLTCLLWAVAKTRRWL